MSSQVLRDRVRCVALDLLRQAQKDLTGRIVKEPGRAIHSTRKRIKFFRALLRLIRHEIGLSNFQIDNRNLRDLSKMLAPSRDAEVALNTFAEIKQEAKTDGLGRIEKPLRRALRPNGGSSSLPSRKVLSTAVAELGAVRDRVSSWPLREECWRAVLLGLHATYRRARRCSIKASKDPTDEVLHEWRKSVKYLWHQMEILQPLCPRAYRRLDALKNLSDLLGDDHDLTLLSEKLTKASIPVDGAGEAIVMRSEIDKRHKHLRDKAIRIGATLFHKKPKAFVRSFEECLESRPARSRHHKSPKK